MKHHSVRSYLVGALLAVASVSSAWAVEINGASSGDLIKIGFSRTVAARIVAYQKSHGDFQNADAVLKVKGVTQGALNRVATKLTVNGNSINAYSTPAPAAPPLSEVPDAPQDGNMNTPDSSMSPAQQ